MFSRLVAFRDLHGHCLVPNRYPSDPSLGSWVSTQRRQYKALISGSCESTPMTPERAQKLERVGFVWAARDPRHVPWEIRYRELCEYNKRHGNCLVPAGYKENAQLSNWVSTQRQEYKLAREGLPTRLTADRIEALNTVGFVWEAQRGGPRRRKRDGSIEPPGNREKGKAKLASNDETRLKVGTYNARNMATQTRCANYDCRGFGVGGVVSDDTTQPPAHPVVQFGGDVREEPKTTKCQRLVSMEQVPPQFNLDEEQSGENKEYLTNELQNTRSQETFRYVNGDEDGGIFADAEEDYDSDNHGIPSLSNEITWASAILSSVKGQARVDTKFKPVLNWSSSCGRNGLVIREDQRLKPASPKYSVSGYETIVGAQNGLCCRARRVPSAGTRMVTGEEDPTPAACKSHLSHANDCVVIHGFVMPENRA